jgi:tetratricopeptide (TPR) repeat protein
MAMPNPVAPRTRNLVAAAALLVATLAAYAPAFDAGWIWDDDNYVTAHEVLRSVDGLGRIWLEPRSTPQYYPLTFTSLWIEYQLWGPEPFGFHVTNVLLHALNALLFWRILAALGVPGAWLAGMVFALHPMHVESVAWITERKNVLSGFFYLASALAYLRYSPPVASPSPTSVGARRAWYVLALGCFVAALASKTVACTLPAALLLVLTWKRGRIPWRDVVALMPFLVAGVAAGLVTVGLERSHVGAEGTAWMYSAVERILIAGRILCFYVGTLLWPASLAFIYPRWTVDASQAWQYLYPAGVFAMAGALFAARRFLGLGPLVALLFYAGTLLPALGFFNVYPMRYSFVADHFAYLASLGPIALVAAAVRVWAGDGIRSRAVAVIAVVAIAVLGTLTWRQAHVYIDAETLWRDTVARNPDGWLGRISLGRILADSGRIDEAMPHARAAVASSPGIPEPHNALGALLELSGRLRGAEAQFRAALELQPENYEVHTNLAIVLADLGDLDAALRHLGTALRLDADYVDAHYHAGLVLQRLGRPAQAVQAFANTLLLAPGHAPAHAGMCRMGIEAGRLRDAEQHCREALRLDPDLVEADESLAVALEQQGRVAEAGAHRERAASMRRSLADSHRDQGRSLLREGRPLAAAAHLRESLRHRPDDAVVYAEIEQLVATDL